MNTQHPSLQLSDNLRAAPLLSRDDTDRVDLLNLIRNLWRRKWTIIASAALLGGIVAGVVSSVTPRYEATARVMLNPRETRIVTSQEVVSDLDLSNPVIESEVALIRSSVLLESAVREIGPERLAEFNPARLTKPPDASLLLKQAVDWATMFLEGGAPSKAETPLSLETGAVDPKVGTQDSEIRANPIGSGETRALDADNLYRRIVGRMRGYLEVSQQGSSYVISISATSEGPETVALLVNTIAERYIASQLEERVEGTRRATRWLQTRVADLREQVATAEEAVEVRRAEKLTADGGGLETAAQQIIAMSDQLATARADQAAAQARYDQITELVETAGFPAAAEVLSSPLGTTLQENRAALMRQQADLATRYGPEHPQRQRVAAEIARNDEDLAADVKKIIKGLENEVNVARIRERSLAADVLALEERASSISRTSTDLRDLEREAEALREVYENMLSRLKETRAHEALAQAEAKVIEYALPPGSPSYPRSKLLISAATVAGAGLGLGLALILELSSNTFRTSQQVVQETRLPVLAALPRGRRRTAPEMLKSLADTSDNEFGEGVRQLRTALMFGPNESCCSIAVTASQSGEGKTAAALALAHMNALMGKRVILVDCDFQSAGLCKEFGWSVSTDFIAVLRGDAELAEAIRKDTAFGFDVLPVAVPVPNVSDMMSPGRFRGIVEALNELYDLVIIDMPAMSHAADACVIARAADALVYLVKWHSTPKAAVRQGLDTLAEMGIAPNGIVLTEVRRKRINDLRTGSPSIIQRESRA